tara:strand:- start:720 stop:1007 length:288 start_codon:yes stop_codon:yes gene_type:complete
MDALTILMKKNWKNNSLIREIESSSLKYLEKEAERLHNLVEEIDKSVVIGGFIITTTIKGWEKTNHYILKTKVNYYATKEKYQHKENSHRQEIHI